MDDAVGDGDGAGEGWKRSGDGAADDRAGGEAAGGAWKPSEDGVVGDGAGGDGAGGAWKPEDDVVGDGAGTLAPGAGFGGVRPNCLSVSVSSQPKSSLFKSLNTLSRSAVAAEAVAAEVLVGVACAPVGESTADGESHPQPSSISNASVSSIENRLAELLGCVAATCGAGRGANDDAPNAEPVALAPNDVVVDARNVDDIATGGPRVALELLKWLDDALQ